MTMDAGDAGLLEKIKQTVNSQDRMSPACKDFLIGLLNPDPAQRLGGGSTGVEELKSHSWFSGLDWEAIQKKEVKAPFVPKFTIKTNIKGLGPIYARADMEDG